LLNLSRPCFCKVWKNLANSDTPIGKAEEGTML